MYLSYVNNVIPARPEFKKEKQSPKRIAKWKIRLEYDRNRRKMRKKKVKVTNEHSENEKSDEDSKLKSVNIDLNTFESINPDEKEESDIEDELQKRMTKKVY